MDRIRQLRWGKAHRGSLGFAPTARRGRRDDKGESSASPWHGWKWMDRAQYDGINLISFGLEEEKGVG
jgi:hypothetical protein